MEQLIKQITQEVMTQISNAGDTKTKTVVANQPTSVYTNNTVITGPQIARLIDHTLLKPDSTKEQIIKICEEAKEYNFATVCVNSYWVSTAKKELQGSKVGITTVVGFPLGASGTFTKVAEARDAIADGATEVDMVMNIGALKSGDYETVKKDIEGVVLACKEVPVKVILETGYLTEEEKKKACMLSKMAGAAFVKTSTGFGPGCATPEDIALMREAVGPEMGVKASACVRDLDTARKMVAAGATRIGASAGIAIVKGEKVKASGNY